MTAIDDAYTTAQVGSHDGFTTWVRHCETPLRQSLRTFAHAVDVESVLQECLLRMWCLAPTLELAGENASLHYARRLARNLAISEVRRLRTVPTATLDALEQYSEETIAPVDLPDPGLRRAIIDCVSRLPARSRDALLARLQAKPDEALARELKMTLNSFLQNIVRARRRLARCLESRGVSLDEVLS